MNAKNSIRLFSFTALLVILIHPSLYCTEAPNNSNEQAKQKYEHPIKIANYYNALAQKFIQTNTDSSIYYANTALKLAEVNHYDYGLAMSMVTLGINYHIKKDYSKSESYLKKAIEIFQNKKDKKSEALIESRIGDMFADLNIFDKAIAYYKSSHNIYSELNDYKACTQLLRQKIGYIYINNGAFSQALDVLFQALKISEEKKFKTGIADSYNDIAVVYWQYENFNSAKVYFNKAMNLYKEIADSLKIALCLNNIGLIYAIEGNTDEALKNYFDAISIYNQIGKKSENIIALVNIGKLYQDMGKYNKALEYYSQALEITKESDNKEDAIIALVYTGDLYSELGNYKQAEILFKRCLAYALETENRLWIQQTYFNLAYIYENLNDYKSAYKYEVLYSESKDSLFNLEKSKEVAKIELKYKNEKQEEAARLEKRTLTIVLISFIAGFTLLFILAFLIYRNYRIKRKSNLVLSQKNREISLEQEKSDKLLLNVLPEAIASRLKEGETTIAERFEEASVVFIDISQFTFLSSDAQPERIVEVLNHVYTEFDKIAERHDLEKIKTIGDCYMAVAGLPEPRKDHAAAAANFAIDAIDKMNGYNTGDGTILYFKAGIDCGPVVAGVIGEKKFIYDLWGDTVNTASRMEEYGEPGKIQVTERFKNTITNYELRITNYECRE